MQTHDAATLGNVGGLVVHVRWHRADEHRAAQRRGARWGSLQKRRGAQRDLLRGTLRALH